MFSDLISLLLSKEVILLFSILGGFVYLSYQKDKKGDLEEDELYESIKERDENHFNMILMTSLIIFSTAFVLGILFSDKVIKFLMSFSQLASIGLFLNKIKSFFTQKNTQKITQKIEIPKETHTQSGGGIIGDNLYDDVNELPYEADSDDEYY